jgi:hypothetical protein
MSDDPRIVDAQVIEHSVQTPKNDGSTAIGVAFTVLGGMIAIAAGIYVTRSGDPLWALILLAWLAGEVKDTDSKYKWRPMVAGLTMGLACVGLGLVVLFTGSPGALWAMILLCLVAKNII